MLGLKRYTVRLEPHHPEWQTIFESTKREIVASTIMFITWNYSPYPVTVALLFLISTLIKTSPPAPIIPISSFGIKLLNL